ncbi:MAG: methyltransferase domain-containing protein [Trichocoleus desertorum ATA4-8-CV12]|jgi:ubiquinone/menaquinone biosynthesis C-methylase UbiE|nr:methyltransferase domain-containing protein [Trichocoleus desertorum ATA4-8-CV12]
MADTFLSPLCTMNQEEVTRQQFDQTASAYSTAPLFTRGQDLQWLVEAAHPSPDWQILDVGCGAGHTAFALAPFVQQVIGIDLSAGMLAEAERNLGDRGLSNVWFQPAIATALPFADQQFDLVTCRFVAHHFPAIEPALAEIHRVLKPDGQFLAVDVISPEDHDLAHFINRIEQLRDPSHYWEWQLSQWHTAIASAGMNFEVLKQWRLPIDFEDWVTRQQTPPAAVIQLEECLDHAPLSVQQALVMTRAPQRTFQLWAALMRGVPIPDSSSV